MLQSKGSQRVRHDLAMKNNVHVFHFSDHAMNICSDISLNMVHRMYRFHTSESVPS